MNDLEKIYQQIDQIDDQLTSLFAKRLELSKQIAKIKYANQRSIASRSREAATLNKQSKSVTEALRPFVTDWYRDIILITKQCQAKLIKQLQDNEDE